MQGLGTPEQQSALEVANPRFSELAAKFGSMAGIAPANVSASGDVSAAVTNGSAGSSLASSMLRLRLKYSTDAALPAKVISKRVPSA